MKFIFKIIGVVALILAGLIAIGIIVLFFKVKSIDVSHYKENRDTTNKQALDKAITTGDVSNCSMSTGISDISPVLRCYINFGVATGDVSVCKKYPTHFESEVHYCREEIAFTKDDPLLCEEDNYCIATIAMKRNDVRVCNLISTKKLETPSWTREDCINGVNKK